MDAGGRLVWYCHDCNRWVKGYRCPHEGGHVPSGGIEDRGNYVPEPVWFPENYGERQSLGEESRPGVNPE